MLKVKFSDLFYILSQGSACANYSQHLNALYQEREGKCPWVILDQATTDRFKEDGLAEHEIINYLLNAVKFTPLVVSLIEHFAPGVEEHCVIRWHPREKITDEMIRLFATYPFISLIIADGNIELYDRLPCKDRVVLRNRPIEHIVTLDDVKLLADASRFHRLSILPKIVEKFGLREVYDRIIEGGGQRWILEQLELFRPVMDDVSVFTDPDTVDVILHRYKGHDGELEDLALRCIKYRSQNATPPQCKVITPESSFEDISDMVTVANTHLSADALKKVMPKLKVMKLVDAMIEKRIIEPGEMIFLECGIEPTNSNVARIMLNKFINKQPDLGMCLVIHDLGDYITDGEIRLGANDDEKSFVVKMNPGRCRMPGLLDLQPI